MAGRGGGDCGRARNWDTTLTVFALAPGNWPEWVGAIGTILAFGATSLAIWRGRQLRRIEHSEATWDEALKVTVTTGMTSEFVDHRKDDGTT
jgi:protein-S-isoprenylcysteine O-methyltransferase Ste14